MCECKIKKISQDLGIKQQVGMLLPAYMSKYLYITTKKKKIVLFIDCCLHDEISFLWNLGIITTGCCCGHNIKPPYIGVTDEFSYIMKELGYKVKYNPFNPYNDNEFYPKSVKTNIRYYIKDYVLKVFKIKI